MKVLFSFYTGKSEKNIDVWDELPIIPQVGTFVSAISIVDSDIEFEKLLKSANCWSGDTGIVENILLLKTKEHGYYYHLYILCEDDV